MFARASSRSYICLQCQHRLASRKSSRVQNTVINTPIAKRLQSGSAAARVIEDEQDQDDGQSPVRYEETEGSTRWRHWKPPPTAELGVDVLGKPAEILVLPQRERRRPDIEDAEGLDDILQEESKPKQSIREALAEENKPASSTEALENIEGLRREIDQPQGRIDEDLWLRYRKKLKHGFTLSQLQRYVVAKTSDSAALRSVQSSNKQQSHRDRKEVLGVGVGTKTNVATEIMAKLWGFMCDSVEVRSEEFLKLRPEFGRLLLMSRKLAELQSRYSDSAIQVTHVSGWFKLTARTSPPTAFLDDIALLKSKLVSSVIDMPDDYLLDPQIDRLSLMRKHEVVLHQEKHGGIWTVTAFSRDRLMAFQSEMILRCSRLRAISIAPPLSMEPLNRTAVMPVQNSNSRSSPSVWYRHVSASNPSKEVISDFADKASLQRLDRELDKKQELVQKSTDNTIAQPNTLSPEADQRLPGKTYHEYSAELGQAIFSQHHAGGLHEHSQLPLKSDFLPMVPFLSHFLAQRHKTDEASIPVLPSTLEQHSGDHLIHLYYEPGNPKKHPALEIYATENADGTIEIKEVTSIYSEQSQLLAVPNAHVDLNFKRESKTLLFRSKSPLWAPSVPLMVQLSTALTKDQPATSSQPVAIFSTLLQLDLSCLQLPKEPKIQTSQGEINSSENKPNSAKSRSSLATTKQSTASYALKYAERVFQAIYHTNKSIPNLIEHVVYTPLNQSPVKSPRQMLKLVELPILHYHLDTKETRKHALKERPMSRSRPQGPVFIGHDVKEFKKFVHYALEVLGDYEGFVRRWTKQRVESLNEGDGNTADSIGSAKG